MSELKEVAEVIVVL